MVDCATYAQAPNEEWSSQVISGRHRRLAAEIDLASPARVAEVGALVSRQNPKARVGEPARHATGGVIFDCLPRVAEEKTSDAASCRAPRTPISAALFQSSQRGIQSRSAEDWLEALPPEVFRVKGLMPTTLEASSPFTSSAGACSSSSTPCRRPMVEAVSRNFGRQASIATFCRAMSSACVFEVMGTRLSAERAQLLLTTYTPEASMFLTSMMKRCALTSTIKR